MNTSEFSHDVFVHLSSPVVIKQCMTPKPLHRMSDNSIADEYNVIMSMSKACRYNPEKKKERIEIYRKKRNLRNFNKKIKYEYRKTLADRRPRIRGRFARDKDIDQKSFPTQRDHQLAHGIYVEEDEDEYDWNRIILEPISS